MMKETLKKHLPDFMKRSAKHDSTIRPREVSGEEFDRVIRQHVWWAIGIGLIPVPIIDFVVITGIQINLLRALAKLYGVPFVQDPGKKFIASLTASVLPVVSASGVAASVAKTLPVIGQTAGVMTMPMLGGAATYALGKVFSMHFASGGTFLTFEPERVHAYYAEMFEDGKALVLQRMKEEM